MRAEVGMFTVRNTLFGAVVSALFVPYLLFFSAGEARTDGILAAWAAMQHVWFLLGHLHLRRLARRGRPAVWPASQPN